MHEPYLQDRYSYIARSRRIWFKVYSLNLLYSMNTELSMKLLIIHLVQEVQWKFFSCLGIVNLSLLLCNDNRKNIRMFFFVVFSQLFVVFFSCEYTSKCNMLVMSIINTTNS